jgi:hypothetical protein
MGEWLLFGLSGRPSGSMLVSATAYERPLTFEGTTAATNREPSYAQNCPE